MDASVAAIEAQGSRVDSAMAAAEAAQRCLRFLQPPLRDLDRHLDRRLVRALANTLTAVIRHRYRSLTLLLSELGAYLRLGKATKRRRGSGDLAVSHEAPPRDPGAVLGIV